MYPAVTRAKVKAVIVWLLTAVCGGGLGYLAYTGQTSEQLLFAVGLLFLGYVVATRSIAERMKDISTFLLAAVGLSFPFWIEPLHNIGVELIEGWVSSELIPADLAPMLPIPSTILISGVMISALLYLATGRGTTLGVALLATMIAAAAPALPGYEFEGLLGGMLLWNLLVCANLCAWSVQMAKCVAESRCPHCGFDLRRVSSPTCPACHRRLPSAGPLHSVSSQFTPGSENPFTEPPDVDSERSRVA